MSDALYIIPILAILILIHEIGHFVSARLVGIRVEEFGIGIPPRIFGFKRGGVLYSVNWLPIGGFVRVLGEDGKSLAPDSMIAKGKLARTFFFAAGSIMNLLLAFVLTIVLVGAQGQNKNLTYIAQVSNGSPAAAAGWMPGDRVLEVNGKKISGVQELIDTVNASGGGPVNFVVQRGDETITSTVTPRNDPPPGQGPIGISLDEALQARIHVTSVDPGSPAAVAGIQSGDQIVSINGKTVDDAASYRFAFLNNAGKTVPVVVMRDGQPVTLQFQVPELTATQSELRLGVNATQDFVMYPVAWWKVVPEGIKETFNTIDQMFHGIAMLVRGDVSVQGIAGPIGMGQLTSEVIKASDAPVLATLTNITILLSLNLAILNLLPIPALDGGRLLFVLIETLRGGKKVPPEKEGVVHFVGLVILLAFMLVVAFADINRIVSGQSFLK
ncbi:MAG TPA: RIP metalloprotease RseP [Nitrolancea sp.]|nr:RIP metalloprotease RseP [Nitrolancea sp.]